MVCHACGKTNREGELVCSQCGQMLVAVATTRHVSVITDDLPNQGGGIRPEYLQSVCFDIFGAHFEYPIHDGDEIQIGRGTLPAGPKAAILDLTDLGGTEMGVSRKHAVLRVSGDVVHLIDLDSMNGTFLNGCRLQPFQHHQLFSGDTVCFGALETVLHLA